MILVVPVLLLIKKQDIRSKTANLKEDSFLLRRFVWKYMYF